MDKMKNNAGIKLSQNRKNSDVFSEEEMVDFEEDKSQPVMIALTAVAAVVVFVVIIFIVILLFSSGKNTEDELSERLETEETSYSQEESVENSTETESTFIETEMLSETEILSEAETETKTDGEVETKSVEESQEESSVPEESIPIIEEEIQEPISGNETMEFEPVSETVIAKDVTNLRSAPSTMDESNIVAQLVNGETVSRTGINTITGWSCLDYNGQTVYAVNNYLTTDLNYKPPVVPSNPNRVNTQDGRVIIFSDCDDYVTPKEYVNLRVEPSTSEGDSTVRSQINNGDRVHRTGYSPDSGWSRVEYNGEVLYVVSSMIYAAE